MKTIIVILRWVTLPVFIVLIMFLSFGVVKLINQFVWHGSPLLIEFIAGGMSMYCSMVFGFWFSPKQTPVVFYVIATALILLLLFAFYYTNLITEQYRDNVALIGNTVGLAVGMVQLKKEYENG